MFTIVLGIYYGLIFGALDVEDSSNKYFLEKNLVQDEYYCLPIAGILGTIAGLINELLRSQVIINFFK